jgi:metal-sulfur cluster biosynthetic enzyme
MTTRARVLDALATVRDPELDEPITELRFVTACEVSPGGDVKVRLRLPTPQCAPNFAYLMAADARAAIRRLPGVRDVNLILEDHYTSEEINTAVNHGAGFHDAFPGETQGQLHALRRLFQRKALVARQATLCQALLAAGHTPEQITAHRISDLDDTPNTRRLLELRAQLAIRTEPDAPALVTPDGTPITTDQLHRWLRMANLIRTSLEVNGGICRALLETRYGATTYTLEGE